MAQTSTNSHPSSNDDQLRTKLRNEALKERSEMAEPYRAHKSSIICQSLLESLDLTLGITGITPEDACVAVYSAFPKEVQLNDFIEELYERGVRVAFPCMIKDSWSCNGVEQKMEMRAVDAVSYLGKHVPFLLHPLSHTYMKVKSCMLFLYLCS